MTDWLRKSFWLIPVSVLAFETSGFAVEATRLPPPPPYPEAAPAPIPLAPPPMVPVEAVPPPGAVVEAVPVVSSPASKAQFMSTIQIAVQEETPELMRRSQGLVKQQFANVIGGWPEFRGKHFEIRTIGNNGVVLSLVSDNDIRLAMRKAAETVFLQLDGELAAKGKWVYSKASLAAPANQPSGYLEVVVDDTHTKVRSISAQGVPLRDLLKEVRFQLGALSYLIPGECAQRPVDWSFGEENGAPTPPKNVDALMKELATMFNLECKNENGTYIFSGSCNDLPPSRLRPTTPADFLKGGLGAPIAAPGGAAPRNVQTQVYFPLLPLE